MPTQSGFRRHLRGRIAFQANLSLPPAIPGRCPGLFTVQPSRLRCFLRLFDSQSLSLSLSLTLPLVLSLTLRLFVPLSLCLFDSLSLNVGFVYSLCIVFGANYTFRNARKVSGMQGWMSGLCIVCRVFLFPPFFTYSVEGDSVNHGTRSIPKQNVSTFF